MRLNWTSINLELLPQRELAPNRLPVYVAIFSMLKFAKHNGNDINGLNFSIKSQRISTARYRYQQPLTLSLDLFPCAGVQAEAYCESLLEWLDQHRNSNFKRQAEPKVVHREMEFDEVESSQQEFDNFELDILSPFPFRRAPGSSRHQLETSILLASIHKRAQRLFKVKLPEPKLTENVLLQNHWWHYSEIKQASRQNRGQTRYFKGCEGPLYFSGDITGIYPWLKLAEVVHCGGSYVANGLGKCELHTPVRALLDRKICSKRNIKQEISGYQDQIRSLEPEQRAHAASQIPDSNLLSKLIASGNWKRHPGRVIEISSYGSSKKITLPHPQTRIVSRLISQQLRRPFDRLLADSTHGFRKGRGLRSAEQATKKLIKDGFPYVAKGDISRFFESIDRKRLRRTLDRILPPKDTLTRYLIEQLCKDSTEGQVNSAAIGIPIGLPLSPLLANIFLCDFDHFFDRQGQHLVRYGDDFLIFARTRADAQQSLRHATEQLAAIGLTLNQKKSGVFSLDDGFDFLGQHYSREIKLSEPNAKQLRKPVIITQFADLTANGAALSIRDIGQQKNIIPLKRISNIITIGPARISTPVIQRLKKENIPVVFCAFDGRHIATLIPENKRWFEITHRHMTFYENLTNSEHCHVAKRIIAAKLEGYITTIRSRKNKGYTQDIKVFRNAITALDESTTIQEIRGIEGAATRKWLHFFRSMIRQKEFEFKRRDRNAEDHMNGLFNFTSHLLFTRLASLVRAKGLNPFLGHVHNDGGYEVLVYDLMEPFRPVLDRWLIAVINLRQITPKNFKSPKYLNSSGTVKFVKLFERLLNDPDEKENLVYVMHKQVTNYQKWVLGEGSLEIWEYDGS